MMFNTKLRTLRKVCATGVLGFFLFAFINIIGAPKAAAADCNPALVNSTANFYNVAIQVRVLNPDGSFRKWSKNFTVNVAVVNQAPYGASTIPVNNSINWVGQPGFPTGNANFNAVADQGGTLQCPQLSGGNSTKLVFGDGVDGFPHLACLWGTWGLGPGKEHGVGFRFTPVGIADAGGSGYWVADQAWGLTSAGRGGGLIDEDVNNINDDFTFSYQLTSIVNDPEGNLEAADCDVISGWARDLDAAGGVTDVHVYFDDPNNSAMGIPLGKTNIYRPDPSLQGNYGFSLDLGDPRIPIDVSTGSHVVYVYAINVGGGSNNQISNSPKTIGPCPSQPSSTSGTATTDMKDVENPNIVIFSASVTQEKPNYTATVTQKFYVVRALNDPSNREYFRPDMVYTISGSKTFDDITINNVQSGSVNLKVGDQICSSITIDSPSVTIGYKGSIKSKQPAKEFTPSCKRFVNLPYVSFYGGDVMAGGNFGTSACDTAADIDTNINAAGAGSGVQFAAQALGAIKGFSSARGIGTAKALTFANNTSPLGKFNSPNCIPDYFAKAPTTAEAGDTVNFNRSGEYKYQAAQVKIGGTLQNTNRAAIYVQGDLIITSDIDYTTPNPSWSNVDQIPSLHVYVQGDILISSAVSRITGFFVAQPRADGTGGKIVTCTNADGTQFTKAQLFNACKDRKLTVRGAFVANKVNFLRTYGSLRDATNEGSYTSSNAAEVFDLSPELYMVGPLDKNASGPTNSYNYFTTLPPNL